tara:strand:- start:73 stop:456 length:384 start_codon:yes stop_codon:yes gene_type:complete
MLWDIMKIFVFWFLVLGPLWYVVVEHYPESKYVKPLVNKWWRAIRTVVPFLSSPPPRTSTSRFVNDREAAQSTPAQDAARDGDELPLTNEELRWWRAYMDNEANPQPSMTQPPTPDEEVPVVPPSAE